MRPGKYLPLVLTSAALCTSSTLAAQSSKPASKPTSQPAGQQVVPEGKEVPVSHADKINALKNRLAKLKKEKASFEAIQKAGGMTKLVSNRIKYRNLYGQRQVPQQGPIFSKPKNIVARLMGDTERKKIPANVILTVEGLHVTKAQFDGLYNYLRSYPRPETDEQVKTATILALVEAKAAQAAFAESAKKAKTKMQEIQKALSNGGVFTKLAGEHSRDFQSRNHGGELGEIDRQKMSKLFSQAAFSTPIGKISPLVETKIGYHLIQVLSQKKAASSEGDKVRVRHIMIPYNPHEAKVAAVAGKVKRGEVELAFRDRELKKHAPKQFHEQPKKK